MYWQKSRDRLAAIIASGNIRGYSLYDISEKFSNACKYIPGLKYPSDLLKYAKKDIIYDPASLYVQTCIFRAVHKQALISAKSSPVVIGLEISASNDMNTCNKCRSLDGKKFPVDKAPILPLHWGCRCTYLEIFKGEDMGN